MDSMTVTTMVVCTKNFENQLLHSVSSGDVDIGKSKTVTILCSNSTLFHFFGAFLTLLTQISLLNFKNFLGPE